MYNDKGRGPFIHKFKTRDNFYVYDVNTNNILKVGKAVYDIIDDFSVLGKKEIIRNYSSSYSESVIERILQHIEKRKREDCIFSENRPKEVVSDVAREVIEDELEHGLKYALLNVTEDCNLRCRYCVYSGFYKGSRRHSKKFMSWKTAKAAVDYLLSHSDRIRRNNGALALGFYGGEPLLNFELIKRTVDYFKETAGAPYAFTMTTNGTLLSEQVIRFIVENNFLLLVSLDGNREVHDRNRVFKTSGKGTFKVVMKNLERLREYDQDYYKNFVQFSTALSPPIDYKNLDDFFSRMGRPSRITLVDTYDTKIYGSNPINTIKETTTSQDYVTEKFCKGALDGVYNKENWQGDYRFSYDLLYNSLRPLHIRETTDLIEDVFMKKRPCVPGISKLFVDVEGRLFPCEKIEGRSYFCIGNVDSGINSEKVWKLIEEFDKLRTEKCVNCWAVRLCQACFIYVAGDKGFNREKFRYYCHLFKSDLHRSLELYTAIYEKNPDALDFLGKPLAD